MNGVQPPHTVESTVNGTGPEQAPRLFSEQDVQRALHGYRQNYFELKAQRDAKQEQVDALLAEIDELDESISRSFGAALGMNNLLNPPQQQAQANGQTA